MSRIEEMYNKHKDEALKLITLPLSRLMIHFNTYLLHPKPWRLRLLLCEAKHQVITMLTTKRSLLNYLLPLSGNTTQHGGNGNPSAPVCAYQ